MNFKKTLKSAVITAGAGFCLINSAAVLAQNNPTLSLFPSTVKQDLKESVAATKKLEENIQPIIAQMAETEQLFRSANCDGEAGDAGCAQLKKQLQRQYLDMLTEVEAVLPEVEKSIKATHKSLSKSITKTLGKTKTPYQLQKEFLSSATPITNKIRGKKGGLAKRLQSLLELTSTKSEPGSALVSASSFFLDANESLGIISQTRDAIAQAKTQAALDLELGNLSEEMMLTVGSVKAIINEDDQEGFLNDSDTILMSDEDEEFDDSGIIF